MNDAILVDGEDVGSWVSRVTVVLDIGETPRLVLEGPVCPRKKEDT